MQALIPVSVGELIDKITILEIKAARISDPGKLENILRELTLLDEVRAGAGIEGPKFEQLRAELTQVNEHLWSIEDDIRDCERAGDTGETFVALARAVYIQNDRRAELKRQINLLFNSELIEEKSYAPYARPDGPG